MLIISVNLGLVHNFNCLIRQLVQGIPPRSILDDTRQSVNVNLTRKHLTSRKDIVNIRQAYGISTSSINNIQTHAVDSASVGSWVDDMKKLEVDNPVLLYKEQGVEMEDAGVNDFVLAIMSPIQRRMLQRFGSDRICVDSTHGMTGYDFELTTLLVVDEYDEGFPVAFFLLIFH